MKTVKCAHCGRCFIVIEEQEICPFCKEKFTNVKEQETPEGFNGIFGFKG